MNTNVSCKEMKQIKNAITFSLKTRIAENHKFCSLHSTVIFYIMCCGLYLFFFQ
jgi:hypothetical protein